MVGSPLISIGPYTDAALNRLKLGDYEQASILSNALLMELQVGIRDINPEAAKWKVSHSPFFACLY
jgi:hypothetical protein